MYTIGIFRIRYTAHFTDSEDLLLEHAFSPKVHIGHYWGGGAHSCRNGSSSWGLEMKEPALGPPRGLRLQNASSRTLQFTDPAANLQTPGLRHHRSLQIRPICKFRGTGTAAGTASAVCLLKHLAVYRSSRSVNSLNVQYLYKTHRTNDDRNKNQRTVAKRR